MQKKTNRMNFEGNTYTVEEFYDMYQDDKLNFDTEYQREKVWSKNDDQTLMDSILNETMIGLILLNRQKNGVLDVIDGQQRLRAIIGFMDGDYSTNPKITPGKPISYSDIKEDPDLNHRFLSYKIATSILTQGDSEDVADFFIRINTGSPLTPAEKLHAEPSYLNKAYIQKWVKHPFLIKTAIKNRRRSLEHNLIKTLDIYLSINLFERDVTAPNSSYEHYRDLLRKYKFKDEHLPTTSLNKFEKTLDLMDKTLDGAYKCFNGRVTDFYPLFFLFSLLNENKITNLPPASEIRHFLIKFYDATETIKLKINWKDWAPEPHEKVPYNYVKTLMGGGGITRIKIPTKTLVGLFFEEFPKMEWKDTIRGFNHPQKLAIFNRCEGVCQDCGANVPFDEGEFDHIKRHADGGRTTVENGQLLCESCHLQKTVKEMGK